MEYSIIIDTGKTHSLVQEAECELIMKDKGKWEPRKWHTFNVKTKGLVKINRKLDSHIPVLYIIYNHDLSFPLL